MIIRSARGARNARVPDSPAQVNPEISQTGVSGTTPDGLLVGYHLDGDNGVVAIAQLRRHSSAKFRRL